MPEPADIERRLTAVESRLEGVETRLEGVASDAAAARYLAAAHDRDLADLGVKVEANRRAINALGEQTAARFDRLENEMRTMGNEMRTMGNDMRTGFATTAAGHEQIVGLLDHVIARLPDE